MQKSAMMMLVVGMVMVGVLVERVRGHGRMLKPVMRSSRWRDPRYPSAPRDYTDNQLFCGGFAIQQAKNGVCGVCGDPADAPEPRDNEAGGKYANGVIVETYSQGQTISVQVEITANHFGYFVFKLCPNNNVSKVVSKSCLDQHVLTVVLTNGSLVDRYYIGSAIGLINLNLRLPSDITCTQCVLQWTYVAANSYGCFPDGSQCCVGCGPQENFVNCADVAIISANGATTTTPPPQTATTTIPPPQTASTTTPPPQTATTTTPPPQTASTTPTTTTTTTTTGDQSNSGSCHAVAPYDHVPGMDQWCVTNCAAGFCPPFHCSCS
ncbi:hypothetical protein ACOMHN_043095 [Nucella lapillus]